MKLAVTSNGPDITDQVDPRFGRAKYFIVADSESGEATSQDNEQNLNAAQGAGVQAGQTVVGLGVEAVLTGHIGPKAFATLQAGGVKVYIGASGSVADAIEQFKAGQLDCAGEADVQGHWA
jgi:predicted Fe-Mo cluster-binding NifX family protein